MILRVIQPYAFLGACLILALPAAASAGEFSADLWLSRFSFEPPRSASQGVCKGTIGDFRPFSIRSDRLGKQLVRLSLPFAPGALPKDSVLSVHPGALSVHPESLVVHQRGERIEPDFRILTLHPGTPPSVRRGILTFPFDFKSTEFQRFTLSLEGPLEPSERRGAASDPPSPDSPRVQLGSSWVEVRPASVEFVLAGGTAWKAELIAPERSAKLPSKLEVVERGRHYVWVRLLLPDPRWPRIIDARLDGLGTLCLEAQVQRLEKGDGTAPDLGWRLEGPAMAAREPHSFAGGSTIRLPTQDGSFEAAFPRASFERRGSVRVEPGSPDRSVVKYLRSSPGEGVPFQESAWRTATVVVGAAGRVARDELLQPELDARVDPGAYLAPHSGAPQADLTAWSELAELRDFTRTAILRSVRRGDDFGNVTSFSESADQGSVNGMNRLNHAPAIFEEGWRSGDRRLIRAVTSWCINMHDLSLWWGDKDWGGTRYVSSSMAGRPEHQGDQNFMWRTNDASNFCTKGYDTFFLAYEETGDPRMLTALRGQVAYAREHVHADRGECRNIGDASDFMRLYRATGLTEYREEAMRLFRELRSKLSTGDLFDQGGKPLDPDPPFINDDEQGYKTGYAKPYIIGYALAGLPDLLRDQPEEPKLRDCVRAVADFLARSQDPAGGWRYPHPRSGSVIVGQAIEHAMHLCRAAGVLEEQGEPIENLLDAIERVLQGRINVFRKSGKLYSGIGPWEAATGLLKDGKKLGELYRKPEDRDAGRDYTEGSLQLGGSQPEGLVYFEEVLSSYLRHRPAERLFNAGPELQTILGRLPTRSSARAPAGTSRPPDGAALLQTAGAQAAPIDHGVKAGLPTFAQARMGRMTFPLAWEKSGLDFRSWRRDARAALLESFLDPPPRTAFDPEVIAVEDRGSHEARKIAFNVSADSRIAAYLLIPRGRGPNGRGQFPAILALHDHGAHFSIGKEKVIRPFSVSAGVSAERLKDAEDWVKAYYGGRFIGDELAARGFVVLAMDALFWGDRGRAEGVKYEAQETLAANMLQLGQSWAGVIAWDDLRGAEFVQSLPEVDPARIGCIGLSMGSSRAWHLAAASDIVKAGAAICWLGDTQALLSEGNNQTKGQSAFSMTHPGLRNALDFPDVASIACPKAMLFFNGEQDGLFPLPGVERSYDRMRRVWVGQGAGDRLVTKIWPVPHVFSLAMQEEAFAWLERRLKE